MGRAVDRDDSGKALVTLEFKKNAALWPSPKMFERPIETRQEVGAYTVGKIERRDHGAQKTGKSRGKQKSLLSAGHGPLRHLLPALRTISPSGQAR